jgi:hypothetical protein
MTRSCAIRRLSAIDPGPATTRKVRFSVYFAYFADYGTTYGSLGAALVGAEVNTVVYHHGIDKRGNRGSERAPTSFAEMTQDKERQVRGFGGRRDLTNGGALRKEATPSGWAADTGAHGPGEG